MTKFVLSLALVLMPAAFAATNDELSDVVAACQVETLETVKKLKEREVELSLEDTLDFFGSCVKQNIDVEAEDRCSHNDDRCYP